MDQQSYHYFLLGRNNFEYASQVWSPQTIQLIESMENVQTRTMFHIHQDHFNLAYFPYPIASNIFVLFKIVSRYTYIDDSARPIMTVSGITSSQDVNRERKKCRSKFYESKVKQLKSSHPKQWWKSIKALCGMNRVSNASTFSHLIASSRESNAPADNYL